MEEVDKIILSQLRQIGTDVPDDLESLAALSTELLVAGCAQCINTINGDDKVSGKLPQSMSARFRVGTELANAVKALGYMSDLGYNSFLYSNEADARNILMWLVERLPKESIAAATEVLDAKGLLARAVASEIELRSGCEWTPPGCKPNGVAHCTADSGPFWFLEGTASVVGFKATPVMVPPASSKGAPAATRKYHNDHLDFLTTQTPSTRDLVASITESVSSEIAAANAWEAEWNSKGVKSGLSESDYKAQKAKQIKQQIANQLRAAVMRSEAEGKRNADMLQFLGDFADVDMGKSSKFANQEKVLFSKETETVDANAPKPPSEEEMQKTRDEAVAELEGQVAEANGSLDELQEAIATFTSEIQEMLTRTAEIELSNEEREEQYKQRKKVLDLLPNADENIERLKQVVQSSSKRILALGKKWEERRSELMDTLRKLRRAQGDAESHAKAQLGEIKKLRAEMKGVAEGAKGKDQLIQKLRADYEAVNKQVGRASYTRRTFEIVRNITKQKEDINRVLQDTRILQKDIAQLSEKLGRVFGETDELIFANAKKDEASRQAYKHLANLHSTCNDLLQGVENTGAILREIRELEEQIEAEETKNMKDNLKRIAADLKTIKKENAGLVAELKG